MSSVKGYIEYLFASRNLVNSELVNDLVMLVECAEMSAWSRGYNEGYLDGLEEEVVN